MSVVTNFISMTTASYLKLMVNFCDSLNDLNSQFFSYGVNKANDQICYARAFVSNGLTATSAVPSGVSSKLKLYYQNVRGLRTKLDKFALASASSTDDVIALTETSLHSSIFDCEVFDSSDFFVYWCDRSVANSESDVGGGVLIAVRSTIRSELVTVPGNDGVEIVVVRLEFERNSVFVCCLYIPSGSGAAVYRLYYDALQRMLNHLDLNETDELWVLGDFNLSKIDWVPQSDLVGRTGLDCDFLDSNVLIPSNVGESEKAELLHLLLSADLHQVNCVRNDDGRLLDLVFTSNPFDVDVAMSLNPLSVIDNYHPPLEMFIPMSPMEKVKPNDRSSAFNYSRADYAGLKDYLGSVDWDSVLRRVDGVDAAVDAFYDVLLVGLNDFVPRKRNVPVKHPPWYTKRIRSLKNERNKAHEVFKRTGELTHKLAFFAARNQFEAAQNNAFNAYLGKVQDDLVSDPSKFWHYVKSKRDVSGYPSIG